MNRARQKERLGQKGQAMIEAAIVLPVYLALFIGIFYFSLRSMNQGRAAMAARHGAWAGSKGHYDKVERRVQMFFTGTNQVRVAKSKVQVDPGSRFIGSLVNLLSADTLKENVSVTASYAEPPFYYAAPDPSRDGLLDFMTQTATNAPVTVVFCERGDCWNNTYDFIKRIIGNIF